MKTLILIFALATCLAQGQQTDNKLQKKTLVIALGETLKPWVIEETQSGIIIDIIKECLKGSGYDLEFSFLPYLRRVTEYNLKRVNVAIDINPKAIEQYNMRGYFSGTIYTYQNEIYALSDSNVKINKLNDLRKYSLVSWKGATKHLGEDYAKAVKNHSNYTEVSNQKTQVKLLLGKRYESIQIDKKILHYYLKEITGSPKTKKNPGIKKVFSIGDSPNGILFESKRAHDYFKKQYEKIKNNGTLDEIYARYN